MVDAKAFDLKLRRLLGMNLGTPLWLRDWSIPFPATQLRQQLRQEYLERQER